MRKFIRFPIRVLLFILFLIPLLCFAQSSKQLKLKRKAEIRIKNFVCPFAQWQHLGKMTIDSLSILNDKQVIQLYFSTPVSYIPLREPLINSLEKSVKKLLGRRFRNYDLSLVSNGRELSSLVPNLMREILPSDEGRQGVISPGRVPLVSRIDNEVPKFGLYNNNIALWDSHGWFFDSKQDRWKWQRARLFGTVEDMLPMSFVLPYLIPMLENSGALVFIPRERDWQSEEVIVDNDRSSSGSEMIIPDVIAKNTVNTGFLLKDTLFANQNPFLLGSSLRFFTEKKLQPIQYIPSFSKKGRYSVSVTYQSDSTCSSNVVYCVFHNGGKTEFRVNQLLGGGTWIYLGTFDFEAGINPDIGQVTLRNEANQEGYLSVDAVKFGGGMGNVVRKPLNSHSEYTFSGKPRYLEGARYFLQSSGFPDSLTYNPNKDKNDYNDDYQSRGEWVNYLMGNPNGPDKHRDLQGLKIPVDLALAFHTDAGLTTNDSIIGTLGIYSTKADKGFFPNGKSRLESRDLTDIVQSQVVADFRQLVNPQWTRRGLWDKPYSEAWRPNTPTMLLELLSHQNIADMRFGLDPRFRFIASRAIYKGILKFQAYQENRPYIVQPLPPDHFSILRVNKNLVKLSWRESVDLLEPSAKALKFKIYQRINDLGFDNGRVVEDTLVSLNLERSDCIYSFKVSALNQGGESFSSEILSVGLKNNEKGEVLIVNNFNRICAPTIIDTSGFSGLANWKDQGVADHQNISLTGNQYDFDRKSKWIDDDNPGWGASYGNLEGRVIAGNNFDYPLIHGKAIMDAGYSFVSVSDEVFSQQNFNILPYFATDIILGEERSTPSLRSKGEAEFTIYKPSFKVKLSELINNGANLFMSGAYITSEFGEAKDSLTAAFVKKTLHFSWRTGHASLGGAFYATQSGGKWFKGNWKFNVQNSQDIYAVEAPDGIEPVGANAYTAFRYSENSVSAGIFFKGIGSIVAMGFPFETILNYSDRSKVMQQIFNFFESK